MPEPNLEIQGKEGAGRIENEADKVTACRMKPVYESREYALGVVVNDSLKNNHAAFVLFSRAHNLIVRTDQNITIRLNSVANDAISVTAAEGAISINIVEMTDVFITTTVATNIKILLV